MNQKIEQVHTRLPVLFAVCVSHKDYTRVVSCIYSIVREPDAHTSVCCTARPACGRTCHSRHTDSDCNSPCCTNDKEQGVGRVCGVVRKRKTPDSCSWIPLWSTREKDQFKNKENSKRKGETSSRNCSLGEWGDQESREQTYILLIKAFSIWIH